MVYWYIAISLVVCVLLVLLAKQIGRIVQGELIIVVFFSLDILVGLFHYKLLTEGQVGPVLIEPSSLLAVSSLLFLVYLYTVPVWVLRKSIVKHSAITGVVLK